MVPPEPTRSFLLSVHKIISPGVVAAFSKSANRKLAFVPGDIFVLNVKGRHCETGADHAGAEAQTTESKAIIDSTAIKKRPRIFLTIFTCPSLPGFSQAPTKRYACS
jgi:hypothetical protein